MFDNHFERHAAERQLQTFCEPVEQKASATIALRIEFLIEVIAYEFE